MVFLSTDLRPPRGGTDDRLLRLAADTGAAGVHVAAGCDLSIVPVFTVAAARLGLEARSIALPLPEQPLATGRRLPRLAAAAEDERDAAVALAVAGLEMGAASGARFALLDFGPRVAGGRARPTSRARSPVARLRPTRRSERRRSAAERARIGERRARAAEVLDACGFALDRLARVAERPSATLVLPVAADALAGAQPARGGAAAGQVRGRAAGRRLGSRTPVGALRRWGCAISDERLASLAAAAVLALENDAVGMQAGYLPGLGERDARVAALRPPAGVARIVMGAPDATEAEVAVGSRRARALSAS